MNSFWSLSCCLALTLMLHQLNLFIHYTIKILTVLQPFILHPITWCSTASVAKKLQVKMMHERDCREIHFRRSTCHHRKRKIHDCQSKIAFRQRWPSCYRWCSLVIVLHWASTGVSSAIWEKLFLFLTLYGNKLCNITFSKLFYSIKSIFESF